MLRWHSCCRKHVQCIVRIRNLICLWHVLTILGVAPCEPVFIGLPRALLCCNGVFTLRPMFVTKCIVNVFCIRSQFVHEINLVMCRQYDWLSAKMLQVDLCYSSRFTLAHQQWDAVWTPPPLKIACLPHHSTMHQTLLRIWASSWGILGWPCIVYILLYNMMSFVMRVQQLLRIVCHKFERIGRWEGGAGEGRGKSILQIACRCWGCGCHYVLYYG